MDPLLKQNMMSTILQSIHKMNEIENKFEKIDRKNEDMHFQLEAKFKEKLDEPMKQSTDTIKDLQREVQRVTREIALINRNASAQAAAT